MTYTQWYETNQKKHQNIVDKLKKQGMDKQKIYNYFNFDNMVQTEVDFCLLYKDNKKCHDMDNLNCYFCACLYFEFDDNAKKLKSWCSIDSKYGKIFEYDGVIHQDCSDCLIPHNLSS